MSKSYDIPEKVWGVLHTDVHGPIEYDLEAGKTQAKDEREAVVLEHLVERGFATVAAPTKKKEA